MIAPGSLMRSGLILLAMIVLTIAGPVGGAAVRKQAPCRVPDTAGPVIEKRAGFFLCFKTGDFAYDQRYGSVAGEANLT